MNKSFEKEIIVGKKGNSALNSVLISQVQAIPA